MEEEAEPFDIQKAEETRAPEKPARKARGGEAAAQEVRENENFKKEFRREAKLENRRRFKVGAGDDEEPEKEEDEEARVRNLKEGLGSEGQTQPPEEPRERKPLRYQGRSDLHELRRQQVNQQRLKENIEVQKTVKTELFGQSKFEQLEIHSRLKSSLKENGFETLTKIQQLSIPVLLGSSENFAIKSETGSGKTLAYLLPILNHLTSLEPKIQRADGTFCIVICPTRELCIQCIEIAQKIVHWISWGNKPRMVLALPLHSSYSHVTLLS